MKAHILYVHDLTQWMKSTTRPAVLIFIKSRCQWLSLPQKISRGQSLEILKMTRAEAFLEIASYLEDDDELITINNLIDLMPKTGKYWLGCIWLQLCEDNTLVRGYVTALTYKCECSMDHLRVYCGALNQAFWLLSNLLLFVYNTSYNYSSITLF